MQYIIHVYEGPDEEDHTLYSGPLEQEDAAYLKRVIATMKPLSAEDYKMGPAAILQSAARFSYVLEGNDLYWCIEWDPGFVVLRFSPSDTLAWTAIRSPIPNFGRREPLPEDLTFYDDEDDEENPQYNLIFTPWDAQFDQQRREWDSFEPANAETAHAYQTALDTVNSYWEQLQARFEDGVESWQKECYANMKAMFGEGIRMKSKG